MRDLRAMRWLAGVAGLVSVIGVGALLATPARPAQASALHAAPQQVFIDVFRGHINGKTGVPGPDKKGHDTLVPSTFAVKLGVPVKVTVVNYDEGAHSIVVPALGLNVTIKPGIEPKDVPESAKEDIGEGVKPVATTFTFTPTKAGVYRWYCALPCDAGQGYWAMGMGYSGPDKEGAMAGFIVVLAGA